MGLFEQLFNNDRPEPKPLPITPVAPPIQPDPGELARKRRAAQARRFGVMDLRIEPSVPSTGMGNGLAILPNE